MPQTQRLNWGILGTGNIARQFCTGVNDSLRGRLAAVGSRQAASAEAFAGEFHIPRAVGDYASVLADPAVDAVYVSLPNHLHHAWTLAALAAGKHVLCEKPLAMNEREAREMFAAAHKADRLLMEAFMYRTHPLTAAVRQAAASGAIGTPQLIRTSFCYRTRRIAGNIRFDPAMGGGGLMDVGCYCIDFSRLIAGREPIDARAMGRLHATGVDDLAVGTLNFGEGLLASFTCGMTTQADNTAYICGDEGYIEIPIPWKPPRQQAEFVVARGTPPKMDLAAMRAATPPRQAHHVDAGRDLYALEADAFFAAICGEAAPAVSMDDSLSTVRLLDALREQVGVVFPTDRR